MNYCKIFGLISILLNPNFLTASSFDYIYPNQAPSFSNYGTIGLLSSPSARFLPEGTVAFSWTSMQPYLRGSIVAYPFEWMEASYQYADINNQLYSTSFAFSGNQTFKDKGFDVKLRMFEETDSIPAIAIGLRDLAGTGLFSSEYIVGSKRVGNIDFTVGLGWGTLSGNSSFDNPLWSLSDEFLTRESVKGSKGGEFTVKSFFSGPMGSFGGLEIFLPYLNGARIKLEYDGVDYSKEGFPPILQESRFNAGFIYPVTNSLHFKLGLVRGNTINFGFSFSGNFSKKGGYAKKRDPHIPVKDSEIVKQINDTNDRYLYRTALQYLKDRKLYVQAMSIDKEEGIIDLAYSQSTHISNTRATGRVAKVLDEISPDDFTIFNITILNADMGLHTVEIDRDLFHRNDPNPIKNITLNEESILPVLYDYESYEYKPITPLPTHIYKIIPNLRSQLGGPDGFYFGDLRIAFKSELILRKNLSLQTSMSAGVIDNYDELKLASDSILPHVRTDIVQYLKQTKYFSLERLQLNYFNAISENLYSKISAGFLEPMFGGYGGEILYKPFYNDWAVGAEIWRVKQRSYDQKLDFLDYETTTGHLNFYYKEPYSKILLTLKGGKFLAQDSGIHVDLSRIFKTGLRMGVYFAKTDISRQEFGEGSFEKGWYFHVPIESFFSNYSRGYTGFGLRPVTRDGAATLMHAFDLYGVTDPGNSHSLMRDWDDLYD